MAEKPYALTERDAERLREMYTAHKNHAPPTRPRDTRADDEEWLGPECYVALAPSASSASGTASGKILGSGASGGIPARVGLTPGAATCDVFRLVGDDLYGPLFTEDVRNLSTAAVAADSWVIIQRDKSGTWWVAWTDAAAAVDQTTSDLGCRYEIRAGLVCESTSTTGGGTGTGTGGGSTPGCVGPGDFTAAGSITGGGQPWSTESGALNSGGGAAQVTLAPGQHSGNLNLTMYSPTLPPTPAITGIILEVKLSSTSMAPGVNVYVAPCKNPTSCSSFPSPFISPFPPGYQSRGGITDTFGYSAGDLQPTDPLGMVLVVYNTGSDTVVVSVDHVRMTVCQGAESGGGVGTGGGIIVTPTTTTTRVQEMTLVDTQAPCSSASRIVSRWCTHDVAACCSSGTDFSSGCSDVAKGRAVPSRLWAVISGHNVPYWPSGTFGILLVRRALSLLELAGENCMTEPGQGYSIEPCPGVGAGLAIPCYVWESVFNYGSFGVFAGGFAARFNKGGQTSDVAGGVKLWELQWQSCAPEFGTISLDQCTGNVVGPGGPGNRPVAYALKDSGGSDPTWHGVTNGTGTDYPLNGYGSLFSIRQAIKNADPPAGMGLGVTSFPVYARWINATVSYNKFTAGEGSFGEFVDYTVGRVDLIDGDI